jgi:RNA polymerase sigma factor (sigma-70 family)
VSTSERDRNLLDFVKHAKLVERAARFYAQRFPSAREDDLLEAGNFALVDILASWPEDRVDGFVDHCKRKLGRAMLDEMRVEERHQRVAKAARRAALEVLAACRRAPGVAPLDRIEQLAVTIAAATFVSSVEEGQKGGDDDLADRQQYAVAHAVMRSAVAAMPKPLQRVMALLYVEATTQEEAAEKLGVHVNTVYRHHEKALASIRKHLLAAGIHSMPRRAGGPSLVALPAPEDVKDDDEEA